MATIRFKPQGLAKMRKIGNGQPSDLQFAREIGLNRTTVSRVFNGHAQPGISFIAGVILAYGTEWFADMFEAVDDRKPSRRKNGSPA